MRKIFLDVETKNLFQDVGSNDPVALDISVICIYDSETDKYLSFKEEEFHRLWPILESADSIITYNGDHFDIPLIEKYYKGSFAKIKSVDLLKEIKNSLGRRLKLDSVAEATLGKNKSGNGLEAIAWWRNGEYQKVIDYCIEDVKITKQVYEYALKHGHLKFKDNGELKEIPLKTSDWETTKDNGSTFSLGF